MYKCRTCSKEVAPTAITCPHCGDTNPFYNQEIKKYEAELDKARNLSDKSSLVWGIVLLLFGILVVIGNDDWLNRIIGCVMIIASIIFWNRFFNKRDAKYIEADLSEFTKKQKELEC
jgi:hypothetical protein